MSEKPLTEAACLGIDLRESRPVAARVCVRCIMDTTDPEITFDASGVCSHCQGYERRAQAAPSPEDRARRLEELVSRIKADGRRKPYDCVIGVSGGVDSTYLAVQAKELGLRPLAVHLDNGWDSELAVNNIERFLKRLDIDLHTHVIDWNEFRDLQVAFLRAGTPDSEIPTDHGIVALLYQVAAREGIRYVLLGDNEATESYGVPSWSQGHADWKYIREIHKTFGTAGRLRTYPHLTLMGFFHYRVLRRIRIISLLNFVRYVKAEALQYLQVNLGWRSYGGKHYESIYTKFFQAHILPAKFGYDKRKIHLSSLIASGQMTREAALSELARPLYEPEALSGDTDYVLKKLGLSPEEFRKIMESPPKSFWDYPSYKRSPLFQAGWVRRTYRTLNRRLS